LSWDCLTTLVVTQFILYITEREVKTTNRLDSLVQKIVMVEFIVLILQFPERDEEKHKKDLPEKKNWPPD